MPLVNGGGSSVISSSGSDRSSVNSISGRSSCRTSLDVGSRRTSLDAAREPMPTRSSSGRFSTESGGGGGGGGGGDGSKGNGGRVGLSCHPTPSLCTALVPLAFKNDQPPLAKPDRRSQFGRSSFAEHPPLT